MPTSEENLAPMGSEPPDAAPTDTPSPREERRRQHLDLFRTQVLDAAEVIFAQLGYHGTSLKMIAARCEVSVGSLYALFDSKESLFAAVLERRGAGLADRMTELVDGQLPAEDRLLGLAELQVTYFRDHPHWAHIATSFVSPGARAELPGGQVAQYYEHGYEAAMRLQARVIGEGQRAGRLRSGDPHALARMFSAMVSAHHVIDEQRAASEGTLRLEELLSVIRAAFRAEP
jgi:AcrR family transcriptional regulator